MAGRRPREEEIVRILMQVDRGASVRETCREHEIARETFYRWRRKYGGMDAIQAQRLTRAEEENRRLKKRVEDLELDCEALRDALSLKIVTLAGWREVIRRWGDVFGLSERRGCRLAGIDRSALRYQPRETRRRAASRGGRDETGAPPSSPGGR